MTFLTKKCSERFFRGGAYKKCSERFFRGGLTKSAPRGPEVGADTDGKKAGVEQRRISIRESFEKEKEEK